MSAVVSLSDAKKRNRRGGGGDAPPPDEPEVENTDCPVTPLGTYAGKYYFFAANGEKREVSARDLGSSPIIVSLFGGDTRWLNARFPARDKEGNPINWFVAKHAHAWLVRECEAVGLYDPTLPERGVGVWRVPEGLALHAGRKVRLVADDAPPEDRDAGFLAWGAMWPRRATVTMPGKPASVEDANWLLGLFQRWNWEHGDEAGVFYGLWAAGLLGAAIGWRPHALVVGAAGTGKSTLLELYASASPIAFVTNDFTEPGLRQALTGRAAPLVLDEAEGDQDGQTKLQRVVELLRRASGGDGARTVKGSPGGSPTMFSVTSAAVLGAILPPQLLPQDASRITRLDLCPRAPHSEDLPGPEDRARVAALAPALWGRALAGLPRFRANLGAVRTELLRRGCAPRLADQIGTILAARDMMLQDQPIHARAAVDGVPWLVMTEVEAAEVSGPRAALEHLLASPADLQRHGERPSIGSLVRDALWTDAPEDAQRLLGEHGLRVMRWPGWPDEDRTPPRVLLVANKHPRLNRIFENTAWSQGRWRDDLRRLPNAFHPTAPQRIGVIDKVRSTAVPEEHLPPRPHRAGTSPEPEAPA